MGVVASLVPTQTAKIGFGRINSLRCARATAVTDFAAASADASAVGTFITKMASFCGSSSGTVAGGIGVAGDVDRVCARPDRRQRGVELVHYLRRNAGETPSEVGKPIDGQHADPAAIGEDGQPLAWKRLRPPQRLRCGKQLIQVEHPQQAGAAKRGIVHRVRAGQRSGVGLRPLGALRMSAGLDHDNRLDPSGAPPT